MYIIKENFYDSFSQVMPVTRNYVSTEIFLNPTSKELSDAGYDCRGYMSIRGDIYIASRIPGQNELIHADLLNLLPKVVPSAFRNNGGAFTGMLEDALKYGVCIQRIGRTNRFRLAESYMEEDIADNIEAIQELLTKAQRKNPSLKFVAETASINDFANKQY